MKYLIWPLIVTLLPLTANAARVGDKNLGWPGTTLSETECFGAGQGYGPIDYQNPTLGRWNIREVTGAHFKPQVEQLIRGKRGSTLQGDIDYTLRAIPNHPRALWAMSRLYLRQIQSVGLQELIRQERARRRWPPPECYFQRAKLFAPEDKMISAVFGIYLHRRGMLDASLKEYKTAEQAFSKDPELLYNMGLLYFDRNEVDLAKEYAERAKNLGYPLTGLQKKIARYQEESRADNEVAR